MSAALVAETPELKQIQARKQRVLTLRNRARDRYAGTATAGQAAAALCDDVSAFLIEEFERSLADLSPARRDALKESAAVVAVGGTGRGELAPYSDVDVLFLHRANAGAEFTDAVAQTVRAMWDAELKLGHSIRTPGETLGLARQDAEVATSLCQMRLLWGGERMFERFKRDVAKKVVGNRQAAFVESCIDARRDEQVKHGATTQQLEPDVKCSQGGLRDVHVLQWVGFAMFGTADVSSLRLKGALSKDDARKLIAAREFLTGVRLDLHFHAGKPQDTLTRDEQLRIAELRNVGAKAGQRPVERFMQTYFEHSTNIADIVERFIARHRPRALKDRLVEWAVAHRADGKYRVTSTGIDVLPGKLDRVCGSVEGVLSLYRTAARYAVIPTPALTEAIKEAVPRISVHVTPRCGALFLEILGGSANLGPLLRNIYETGILELVLPEMTHARCLLQFNQYHSYTVDEHTLRTIEAVNALEADEGPLGIAYRQVQHKEILHLALLLHDLGKGREEDHSEVGRRLAETVAARFQLPEHRGRTLAFLVHKHLDMAHTAFRRNIYDPAHLLPFSQAVGSPDTLRMLYALTAADIQAVGPGVWNDWKAELLADLYNQAMYVLSGRHYKYREEQRLAEIKRHVHAAIVPLEDPASHNGDAQAHAHTTAWIDKQLDAFPPHYLGDTSPAQIAADLDAIQQLEPGEFFLDGAYDPETRTVEYRLIAHEKSADGCFHRTVGALTAKRLEILSAHIATSTDGYVVDRYRVTDRDYGNTVPRERIDEVIASVRSVLEGETKVPPLFQRQSRYGVDSDPLLDEPARVSIDNNTSPTCTILDVFAHDRPGLLYTITRTLNLAGASVVLAKISTHLDQVVDVFYLTDVGGEKITDGERLGAIKDELLEKLAHFEREGHKQFV